MQMTKNIFGRLLARMRLRDRRAHRRIRRYTLQVAIDGKRYKIIDWSLGGFRIEWKDASLNRGDRIAGRIGPVDGTGPGHFLAEVMWVQLSGQAGCRFIEIDPKIFLAMAGVSGS